MPAQLLVRNVVATSDPDADSAAVYPDDPVPPAGAPPEGPAERPPAEKPAGC